VKKNPGPKIRRVRKPRLRVIKSDKDIRIPPEIFDLYLARWVESLPGWIDIEKDDNYAFILMSKSYLDWQGDVRYRVTRHSGDIHEVKNFVADRLPIGNIME
jgi:hypothetical protein